MFTKAHAAANLRIVHNREKNRNFGSRSFGFPRIQGFWVDEEGRKTGVVLSRKGLRNIRKNGEKLSDGGYQVKTSVFYISFLQRNPKSIRCMACSVGKKDDSGDSAPVTQLNKTYIFVKSFRNQSAFQ